MFTDAGNAEVHKIAQKAIKNKTAWKKVLAELHSLSRSNLDKYGEATDTSVREAVYITIYADSFAECNELNMNLFTKVI